MKIKHKKDILFLLQFFYPEYISSATLPYDTAVKLVEAGYSVDVLCGYPHEYVNESSISSRETVNGINIKRVKYMQMERKKKIGRIINYLSLTVMMFFRLFSMRKYKTIIVYSNPPILPFVAGIANKLFGCKLVFVAYDLYPEIALKTGAVSDGGIITKIMNCVNRLVYKNASAVIALSTEMKNYIVANREISSDKVFVIPNWYEDEYDEYNESDDNTYDCIVKDRFVVGYFGNMGIAQDMDIIMKAMIHYKNDPNVCFLLSGHGAKQSAIKELIERENINNAYLYGFLKGKDYLDALRISDCAIVSLESGLTGLCVPSKTYAYMMQGLPIVAIMDDSDIANDANDGAGYHVKNNSVENLIASIDEMKTSSHICETKGIKSREKYLRCYTPEKCLEKYVCVIKQL